MPVILALVGALMSGLFMWFVWGNGMEVVNHWLDSRAAKAKAEKDAKAIAEARERATRAPLRALEDPREAVMVLLSKLAMLRGEITAEQNLALSKIAMDRLGLGGKPEHHTALAAFAAKAVKDADSLVADVTPLLHTRLSAEERDDLFAMLGEIAGLHGGATEAQEQMIARLARRMSYSLPTKE
ncbi:MAG: hypothetical protein FD175_1107 [Beijerinckiaceae bacterium]|nr:MAG: hypothetical protein FD175_1107 [Beijerinckiaceae bacterium]